MLLDIYEEYVDDNITIYSEIVGQKSSQCYVQVGDGRWINGKYIDERYGVFYDKDTKELKYGTYYVDIMLPESNIVFDREVMEQKLNKYISIKEKLLEVRQRRKKTKQVVSRIFHKNVWKEDDKSRVLKK